MKQTATKQNGTTSKREEQDEAERNKWKKQNESMNQRGQVHMKQTMPHGASCKKHPTTCINMKQEAKVNEVLKGAKTEPREPKSRWIANMEQARNTKVEQQCELGLIFPTLRLAKV